MQTANAYSIDTMQAPSLETGLVLSCDNECYTLQARDSQWQAALAASCLVRPEQHDEVLFAPLPDGRAFVLAVLTRSKAPCVLHFPEGASLTSEKPIRMDSATAVRITAPLTGLETATLNVRAGEASAAIAKATLVTRILRTTGERLEQTFRRLLGCFGSAQRIVEHNDEVQAQNVRISASESCVTQAASSTTLARDLARIDAPQVHIS